MLMIQWCGYVASIQWKSGYSHGGICYAGSGFERPESNLRKNCRFEIGLWHII